MSITLKKGDSLNLTRKEPYLRKALVGLGWETKAGIPIDLDASLFMLGQNRKLVAEEYFIFYNNLQSPDGSVQHTGDNRTGLGDEDDEIIIINLPLINPAVRELVIVVSIHDATVRNHTFGNLNDAYIRVLDVETNREVLRYDLDAEFPEDTAVEFGRLVRESDGWNFKAVGVGTKNGLQGFVDMYA